MAVATSAGPSPLETLASVGKSQSTKTLLRVIILCIIAGAAVASRLFSVIRAFPRSMNPLIWALLISQCPLLRALTIANTGIASSCCRVRKYHPRMSVYILHLDPSPTCPHVLLTPSAAVDPWFNFRATKYLVAHGFYDFWDWFDDRTWHPLGRVTGGTLYPGLMVTSGAIYHALRALTVPVDIRNICVLLAPAFSGLTAFASYLLTNEMTDSPSAGLLSAIFMGIAPGYISRSVAGSYDNEAIAIFLLVFTFYLWIKALKLGSMLWGALCALFYGYMVASWGGYAFITCLVPLHSFVLVCMGRFSTRLYVSYTTWYALGTLASMQIPFVGFLPVRTSEHMPALGKLPSTHAREFF
jgi:hypothetical protein